jgi:hypothetical protein
MAGQASDYHRGDMDIHAQQSTFHRVMAMTKWASLAVATGVMFFTLWFCTAAGFPTAFLCAVILIAIGVFALRERPGPSH